MRKHEWANIGDALGTCEGVPFKLTVLSMVFRLYVKQSTLLVFLFFFLVQYSIKLFIIKKLYCILSVSRVQQKFVE